MTDSDWQMKARRCKWIGDSNHLQRVRRGEYFGTCDADALAGKPYCNEHCSRAYIQPYHLTPKPRARSMPWADRQDDVADRF